MTASDTGKTNARIAGSGRFLPPHELDNFALFEREEIRANFDLERARSSLNEGEDTSDLSPAEIFDRWARQVTGIRARRVLRDDDDLSTEDLCTEACRRALEASGLDATDVDFIVAASLTGREEVPNVACTVASLLGVPSVPGFTLNAACSGFVYALSAGASYIRGGMARTVLVVVGDALSRVVDYSDPKTAVLFGDGAAAVVLVPSDEDEGVLGAPYHEAEYEPVHLNLRGQGWESDEEPRPKLRMGGGPQVLRQAVNTMRRVAEKALAGSGLEWDDVDLVIPHQANLRITRGLARQLPLPEERVIDTIERYGNLSASGVAVSLDEVLRGEHGEIPDPVRLLLTAVGGGYTSAGAVVECRGFGRA